MRGPLQAESHRTHPGAVPASPGESQRATDATAKATTDEGQAANLSAEEPPAGRPVPAATAASRRGSRRGSEGRSRSPYWLLWSSWLSGYAKGPPDVPIRRYIRERSNRRSSGGLVQIVRHSQPRPVAEMKPLSPIVHRRIDHTGYLGLPLSPPSAALSPTAHEYRSFWC